jgi:hypothetical protein
LASGKPNTDKESDSDSDEVLGKPRAKKPSSTNNKKRKVPTSNDDASANDDSSLWSHDFPVLIMTQLLIQI